MNRLTTGPAREAVDLSELLKVRDKGTLVTDDRRRRPLWFDGRFLDAKALNAEQNYFLARQNDFGRVAGFGVITGLGVTAHATKARTLTIEAGHGLTPSGSQVVLPNTLEVNLADIAEIQRLDASFGLANKIKGSAFNRTGLFIVGLRTVEYTGYPIAAYPTQIDAPRSVHDSSVVEATAVSLVPYPFEGTGMELVELRQRVAREIFVEESQKAQPQNLLPLAMLALDHGVIRWLDVFMVRREIGLRERAVWGLGLSSRPLRIAHLRQYDTHLRELQASLGSNARIIASERFSALPPAGPMPISGINSSDFSHTFFPAEMDVELSLIPEDELPALIEEAILLPPLDLSLSGEAQESTSVLVVLPVPRNRFRRLSQSLPSLSRQLTAAQPGMLAKRKPITALNQLLLRRTLTPILPEVVTAESLWRAELSKQTQLWYLRRRNLHYKAEVTSWSVDLRGDEVAADKKVTDRIAALGLQSRFASLLSRSSSSAKAELTSFMASPLLLSSNETVVKAVVSELEKTESIDSMAVMKVAERFTAPSFGEGLALASKSEALATDATVVETIAESGLLPELDRLSQLLPAEELKTLTQQLAEAGSGGGTAAVERITKVIADKSSATLTQPSRPVVSKPTTTTTLLTRVTTRG